MVDKAVNAHNVTLNMFPFSIITMMVDKNFNNIIALLIFFLWNTCGIKDQNGVKIS